MLEIWRAGGSNTSATPEEARMVEAQGWDGQMFMCSQNLSADCWSQMGAWAVSTEKLMLSPGVTNPFTRNLAVTAGAAATIQAISNGRSVLGIGRGDSGLAYLGHAPVGTKSFERSLGFLQRLLRGEEIPFEEYGPSGDAPPLAHLSLGDRPEGVRLRWLPEGLPKVPLDVAATGPKVIRMAARLAERVTFSVGAGMDRMEWALATARAERQSQGLGDDGVSYGAQLVVCCHPDMDVAMETAMHMAPPLARFQVIEGKQVGPEGDAEAAKNFENIKGGYDMTKHGEVGSKEKIKGGALSPEFVREFAIVGPPDLVTERLLGLKKLGLSRFVIVGPGFYAKDWGDARNLFHEEVIPALRAAG